MYVLTYSLYLFNDNSAICVYTVPVIGKRKGSLVETIIIAVIVLMIVLFFGACDLNSYFGVVI